MKNSMKKCGEFSLIELLADDLPKLSSDIHGIGDDCAILPKSIFGSVDGDERILISKDLLIDGKHFDQSFSSPLDIGWKSVAVNVSDVSAMGGRARVILVGLMMTQDTSTEFVQEVYRGLGAGAAFYGAEIVGGDTVSSPVFGLSITVVGSANRSVLRSGGRLGDDIWVSDCLGGAAFGLRLLSSGVEPSSEREKDAVGRHRRPEARNILGELLAACGVSAMLDVSDGLLQDLGHILESSSLSASIDLDSVPIHGALSRTPSGLRDALAGGDDYELLFTASPDLRGDILACGEKSEIRLSRIGTLETKRDEESSILLLSSAQDPMTLRQFLGEQEPGYSHF
jgi:thiamine-monophosphate kinase